MASRNFNFGRGVIAEGIDRIIMRRNWASMQLLVDQLEKAIPLFEEDATEDAVMVAHATSRRFVATSVTIDPDTGVLTLAGDLEMGAADRSVLSNGQTLLRLFAFDNAVNHIIIYNSLTGLPPSIVADGDDDDVDLRLSPKGYGEIVIGKALPLDADRIIRFEGISSDGTIQHMEDEARFDFNQDVDVAGDITLTGTVDGEDIQTLKAESEFCFFADSAESAI